MENTIEERIEKLKYINKISKNTVLLRQVGKYIYPQIDIEEWVNRTKSNFNKMLSGERSFPSDILVGLEHVLHTNGDYIVNGVEPNREFVPRGLEYAAYVDTLQNYEDLFNELGADGDADVITGFDEYGYTLIDYIIKHKSINGLRFLASKYDYKYYPELNSFNSKDNSFYYSPKGEAILAIAKIISDAGDVDLFYNMFDVFYEISLRYYDLKNSIYNDQRFRTIIINNKALLKVLFQKREYDVFKLNHLVNNGQVNFGFDVNYFVSPLLERILHDLVSIGKHAKKNNEKSDAFKEAEEIANIAISHNEEQVELLSKGLAGINYSIYLDKDGYIDTVGYKISNFVRYLPDENDNDYIPSNLSLLLSRLGEYEERIKKLPERKIVEIVEDESNPASFKDLADYIYLNTEIRQQHRYAPVIINSIKKILDNCHDETIKDNFGQKLLEAFDAKHKELIDNHTKMSEETYNIEYTDIMVAKCFIQLHMDELNTI